MAYAKIEPFGEERADLRAGIVASTIANVNRDPKRRVKPFTPDEFMPDFDMETRGGRKSATEIYAILRTWALLAGAKNEH
jgi:hypothetical protein